MIMISKPAAAMNINMLGHATAQYNVLLPSLTDITTAQQFIGPSKALGSDNKR